MLLSGDSPFAEVYRSLLSDENEGQSADANALIQQLDAQTSAEMTGATGSDFDATQTQTTVKVAWGDSWKSSKVADLATSQDASDTDESGMVDASIDAGATVQTALAQQATTTAGTPQRAESPGKSLPSDADDQDELSDIPTSELPRGPPADALASTVAVTAPSIEINNLDLSNSSETDEGEAFGVLPAQTEQAPAPMAPQSVGLGDRIDLAIQAFADAQELLATIEAAAAEDLPLIGISLNQLLLDSGFDLFGEFEDALAPVTGAVAALGTLTERFAQLEELLEDAFGLADVGGNAAYDNSEIELVYDETDDTLDIVFAFHFGDTDAFVLDDLGLTWTLGLEFTLSVDFNALDLNTTAGLGLTLGMTGAVLIDTADFDMTGEGTVQLDLLEMLGGSVPSVDLQVAGALNLGGAIILEGTFGFEHRTGQSLTLADGAAATVLTNINYTLVSGEGVSGFFGANGPYESPAATPDAVGLAFSGIDFSLLRFTNSGVTYTALTTSGGTASFVGVPDLVMGASDISVDFNSTSDTANPNKVVDFNASDSVAGIAVTPIVGPALEFEGEDGALLDVSGNFALDAFGFVVLAGSFHLVKQSDVAIDDGAGGVANFTADVLSLSLAASGFVGSGASLSQDPLTDISTVTVVTDGAVGFSVPAATLDLVILQDTATKANKYTGLQLGLINAGLVGIDEFGLTVSGTVQINKGPAAGRLNWSQVTGLGKELPGVTLAMDQTVELAIRDGSIALDAAGFVVLRGTFELVKQSNVAVDDGAAPVAAFSADVMSLKITASGFAGIGGSLGAPNNSQATVVVDADAIGFSVPSGLFDLVLVKDRASSNKYTGLQVGLTNAGLVGIDQLGLTVSGLVQVNKGPASGRLDWSKVTGAGNELSTVSLDMDQTVALAIRNGSVALDAFGFVVLRGTFEMVKQTNVAINDTHLAAFSADVLSLSITASGFVGMGGSLSAANNSLATVSVDADALGFSLPSGSVDLVLVKDRAVATNKYTGLQMAVVNASLVGIPEFGLTVSGQVQVNKGPAAGRLDWTQVTGAGKELPGITLAMDQTNEFAIRNGTVALDAFGFVALVGSFNLVKQTNVAINDNHLAAFQADVLSISITASGFAGSGGSLSAVNDSSATLVVGAGALGFSLPSGAVDLVLVKDRATATNKYTGLQVAVAHAGLVGIEDLGLTVSGKVQVNKGPAAGRLDWTQVTGAGKELPGVTLAIDRTIDFAIRDGSVALNAFGFVALAGTFTMVKQADITIDDDNLDAFQADVLSLSIAASGFVGVGGSLSVPNNSLATVVAGTDAIGFSVPAGTFNLVLVKDRATATNKYTGLQFGLANATLVGMPAGFGLTVSGTVEVNKGPASGRLDWTAVTGPGNELSTVTLLLDETMQLSVSGTLSLDVFGFVQVSGAFALEKYSTTVNLAGQTSVTSVDVLALGLDSVNVFVGDGPYFNADGTVHTDSADAIGFLLRDTSLAVALFTRTAGPGTGKFHAVSARAQDIEFVGVGLGASDEFKLDASGYRIEINGGTSGAINFAAGTGPDHEAFEVRTGPTTSVEFNFSSALQRLAIEDATIILGNYIHVSGGFSITRQTNMNVELSGAGTDKVNALVFGAGSVDIFVGNGPYFVDGAEPDANAAGLVLENVNLGLMLMKSVTKPVHKYTTLMATADRVALVGLEGLTMSAGGVTVEYNSSKRVDKKVIDFSGTKAYRLDTGNGELLINYANQVLRASVEDAQLQIQSNVFISGGLAFQKGPSRSVTLYGGSTVMVESTEIGAQGLTMFFGVDGPYWNDLNDNHVVDTGETNPDAVGFAITNANLAMTLLKAPTGTAKYLGLHATADQVGFVGIDSFNLEATAVEIDLNLALGAGVTDTTPVVNFAATYPTDEWQDLFDIFDTTPNGELSLNELVNALGADHGATDVLKTTQELVDLLNAGGAPPDTVLFVTEVTDQLTAAFKTAHLAAIQALDADADGKFDPLGYEIKTGSGYLYLSAETRQIRASADSVKINVAEFLYVNGSVALDIGSRETVIIRTGIPASLGALASDAVVTVNTALDSLESALASLKAQVTALITTAIDALRAELDTLINGVIDGVVDYLKDTFASYVGSLSDLTQAQLKGAIDAVTNLATTALNAIANAFTVDSLVDQMLAPIVSPIIAALPDPLKEPVGDLLDTLLAPIKQQVGGEFAATLEEALGGAISRISGSASKAVEAALQAAAATATGTFDAAVDQARNKITGAVKIALDPAFERIKLELGKLVNRATARLDPLFLRLKALTDIEVGTNFSTLNDVEVGVTALGISNASAFVGLPPPGGFNFNEPFATQIDEAVGLYMDGLSLALGIFKPVLGKQLPNFTALKLEADDAGFSDGGNDLLQLIAKGIEVELNLGGPIVQAAGGVFGNATIDFAASFQASGSTPAGYAIDTSTSGDPIYIDFAGGEVVRASVEHADLQISEFVHIVGSIAFEKGTIETVDVTGGMSGPAVDLVLDELDLTLGDVVPGLPWTGAQTAELSFMTIGASDVHAFVGIGGPYWTDTNQDNIADDDELSDSAKGLWIENFDFGMAIMRPTNVLDFVKYFALQATANDITVVGIEGVEVTAHDLQVEINQSSPSIYGLPLFPVVDFASTYESERQALFDLLAGTDHSISVDELNTALTDIGGTSTALTTVDQLMTLLDIGGAPPTVASPGGTPDGKLTLAEVTDRLKATFKSASSGTPAQTNLQRILALDADDDGKFDPAGYEVNTGSTPVYLAMESSLIRAQGFLELNLFDTIFLTGSVAFELGPVQNVTLNDAAETVKEVTTMTIGAANVTAFIGANGPYWTDTGNHTVEPSELNANAVGFNITDLDMGIMVMASTNPDDLGVYLAAKASVHSFGLVGINVLTATGQFDIALNVGIGASGLDFNADVVDFVKSFPVDPLVSGDQVGFEVNTGDPTSPVVLDFDALLVSFQLGGSVTIYSDNARLHPVVRLNGLLLFEVDTTGLKAFVAAGLEFGPDIGRAANNKFFDMNALGALVINAAGIAADIDVTVQIGGALSDDLSINAGAQARLVLNTTGAVQSITIPARYAGFLDGTVDLSSSGLGADLASQGGANIAALESMVSGGTLDSRFTAGTDGDLIFSISAAAPTMASLFPGTATGVDSTALMAAGPYFAVGISANLVIGGFTLAGRFGLVVNADALQLLVEAKITFFSVELKVKGEANIVTTPGSEGLVLKIQATLTGNFGIAGLFDFDADLELQLNTRAGTTTDGLDLGIARESFRIDVKNASLTFLSLITLTGSGYIEVTQGVFRIQVTLAGNFLNVASITASAFFSSEGEFEVKLDGSITLGTEGFNISGSAHLEVSYLDSNGKLPFGAAPKVLNIIGSLTVSGEIFYISLGSFTIGVSYNSSTGDITVKVGPVPVPVILSKEVDFGLFTATVYYPWVEMKYLTFTVGTLKIVMPPPPKLGQVNSNGVLTLNVGSVENRAARNLAGDTIDEEVMIEDAAAGTTTGRKIKVTMFGVSQTFDNVVDIQIADMADGSDLLAVAGNVTTPLTVRFGSGADTLDARGSGLVNAYGDAGADNLSGGSGADYLDGGADADIIKGNRGVDVTNGGEGIDLFTWNVGDGNDTIDGQGGATDALNIVGTADAQQVTLGSTAGGAFSAVIGLETLTANRVEVADVTGGGGSDAFVVNDLTPSAMRRVNIQLGNDTVQDSLVVNGSDAGETFGIAVKQPVTDFSPTSFLQITRTDGATINVLGATGTSGGDIVTLNTLAGADIVNVAGTLAGLITTINGGNDSDTFNVGVLSGASGSVDQIVNLLTINGNDPSTGSDILNVYDNADTAGNTGTLTSTAITGLGMGGSIAYGTTEHLNIHLGSGGDTFTVDSTHAGETVVNMNGGVDTANVRFVSGATTVNGGADSDIFNVGSLASAANGLVDGIGALLTINGDAGAADALNVDDTGETSANAGTLTGTTLSGLDMSGSIAYGTLETLTVRLGSGGNGFTINGTHGSATGDAQESTTIFTGSSADIVDLNDATDLLAVNGQGGADTLNVNGTGTGSVSTLNGEAADDIFNVRAMTGTVAVNGGAGNDGVNVGSVSPSIPGTPTNEVGNIDAVNGLLTVDGGEGTDALSIDDSKPAVTDKSGTLTATTLRGLELEQGIDYSQMETLFVWLAAGNNTFTISSTHAGSTTVSTALGNDTVNVDGASGTLNVYAEAGDDIVNVRATGLNSQARIFGQAGNDTFNLTSAQNIDAIDGLVVIDGGTDIDVVNVDDSANVAGKAGTLKSVTLRGLELEAGVDYANAEDFNLWLGTGTDGLFVDSTHAGTTDIYTGSGNATVNQRDDTIAIKSIAGVTTVHGQGGNDFFYVNVDASAANDAAFFSQFKAAVAAAANESQFNALFSRTHANQIGAVLNLHGEGDSDVYTLHLAGQGQALINVLDNGAANQGVDTLVINGSATAGDTFLLRRTFVALLNDSDGVDGFDKVERVNYDANINARLIVNGLGGDDRFLADDNSSITTLDGGEGNDTFQIGQIFGTLRDANAGVAPGDVFATTPVIIGVITDPNPANWVEGVAPVIFDPTSFDPVTGVLSPATLAAINAAIAFQNGQALNGVAYVSNGVTHATTIFGGNGQDTFNVYHNKGTLRLEGEADNDTFIVRAFVTIDLSEQGETEVNGGAGSDTINYAINAPVNIDGGAGFDKVIVLGTPFNDSFVVSGEGIFGAGLNVKFINIESAELDTLEGNDTIYVLGTGEGIVTTIIGGLGSDIINVLGDVMTPIVSDDLLGRSGVIGQGLTSSDPDYNQVGVNGVAVNVVSAGGGSLVNITPTGESLRVTEDGAVARYFISLVAPNLTLFGSNPVYLTVSAGLASSTDRSIGGAGVLVRLVNGGAFTNALVLTFDGSTANTVFEIEVQAIDDGGSEGPRTALISHSINSANADYDDLALADVFVNVVDNDQAGLDIRHLADGAYGHNSTQVLENGFADTYSVALTAAPSAGEVVTITLVTDGQISARSAANVGYLTFNQSNWMTAQTVVVTALDDALDGTEISKIKHAVTSSGGTYTAFAANPPPVQSVTVFDDDTPGAIVQQTAGSTVVVENGATDSYRVRLTGAPDANVTLTLRTDMQTRLSGSGLVAAAENVAQGYFEYTYTFTAATWNQWAVFTVTANPGFAGANGKVKAFATQDQNLDQIRGPLIIEGGVGSAVTRAFAVPVMLPGETNSVSNVAAPVGSGTISAQEANDIDALNVFHTDNNDADTGKLFWRTVDAGGKTIVNQGLALTGFEMGSDLSVDQGVTGAPNLVYYGGGVTYNGFETVELLLGKGNEALTVDDTGDRDEKDPAIAADHPAITAIHGGGGADILTINNRGEGPLVVYGDTSDDGSRYSNDKPAAAGSGTSFVNPGNDTINASAMQEQGDVFGGIVIDGGAGADVITGGQDDDHLAGGSGADTIHAQAGIDHIYGDSTFNIDLMLFAQDRLGRFDTATQLASIASMFSVVTSGPGASDALNGGAGNDIVFGDHGVIVQVDGTRRIESTVNIVRLDTTNIANGGGDVIHGDEGNDFIFGGVGADTVYGDAGSDLLFGDHGSVAGSVAINVHGDYIGMVDGAGVSNTSAKFTYTSDISAAADGSAGNDTMYGGSLAVLDADTGKNILLGQQGSDTLYGGGGDDNIYGGHNVANGTDAGDFIDGAAGNDVILGDNGSIERTAAATDPRFAVLQGTRLYDANGLALVRAEFSGANPSGVEARRIQLFDHDTSPGNAGNFGNDTIAGGADDDVIFGQLGADTIHGDGLLAGTALATLTATIANSDIGGDDYIEGNGDGDRVYGGLGQDDIIGGSSSLYNLAVSSMRPDGADTIFGGNGDLTARNIDGDGIHARDADMILGDNGNIFRIVGINGVASGAPTFNYDNYQAPGKIVVRAAHLLDYTPGGPDLVPSSLATDLGAGDELHGESGDDFIYGMTGSDVMFGEGQDDDLIGGWGNDWISGGTGQDGVLGDDGRIFTSRNGTAEALYGITAVTASRITTPGNGLVADINVANQLKKSVDLTPYNVDPSGQPVGFTPRYADDIIYGGLGSDFLHGGSGDDAISGAEAMAPFYTAPVNAGNVLRFNSATGEFADYNENSALRQIPNFLLNFNANEGVAMGGGIYSDGDDQIFGDLGNDWLVGGTGRDHMYGGWGNDLLNADDNLGTNGGLNSAPDNHASYEDIAFGGAGRDRLIGNTANDRLVDWSGEFNSYLVPFNPFGAGTVSRAISPAIPEFLYALSKADGADQTLGGDSARNSEPFGELGLVKQGDAAWGTQTGGPDDPQPGSGGGKK